MKISNPKMIYRKEKPYLLYNYNLYTAMELLPNVNQYGFEIAEYMYKLKLIDLKTLCEFDVIERA